MIPLEPDSWIETCQVIEYGSMMVSKRAQGALGNTIMASGAAGVYRIDVFLQTLRTHDGEHIGDDLQTALILHHHSHRIGFLPGLVVQTIPPQDLTTWWKQRAKRWELSPIYLSPETLQTVLGWSTVGWWIRWIAFYRLFVSCNDVLRVISFPVVLIGNPKVVVGVWIISYICLAAKAVVYCTMYPEYRVPVTRVFVLGMLTYPIYGVLTWFSRIWAIPKSVVMVLNRRRHGVYSDTTVEASETPLRSRLVEPAQGSCAGDCPKHEIHIVNAAP